MNHYYESLNSSETIGITKKNHHWCFDTAVESINGKFFLTPDLSFLKYSILKNIGLLILSPYFAIKIPKSRVYLASEAPSLLILFIKRHLFKEKFIAIQYVKSDYYNRQNHKGINGKFLDIIANVIDGAIVPGRMVEREIRLKFDFPVEINYHYPQTDEFYKIKSNPKTKNIIIIGVKSRFRKGTDIVYEVAREMPNTKFYLLGNLNYLPQKFVKKLKKQKNIILTGFADPKEYIPKCTYFFLPGRYDAGPIALTEAMASGLIPIISNMLGGQDLVKEVNSKFVVNSKYSQDYINSFKYLNNLSESDRQKISKQCRNIALRHTRKKGQEDFRKKFNSIIQQVLKES